jgi:hypothetical protein
MERGNEGILTGFDVSPNHWCHVTFIVHETGIKVWSFVWVRRYNVRLATGEWILQEMKHRKELSGRHQHVITEPSCNNRVMHNRLVGFILEVAVPAALEVWSRPRLHLFQLLFSWTNLDTSIDAIGGKWSCALDVPFIENCFLNFRDTTNKVVETFGFCDCQKMLRRGEVTYQV